MSETRSETLRLNGLALQSLGRKQPEEARRLLGEALAADAGFLPGWLNLATAYRLEGRLDQALSAVRSALSIDPLSFRALLLRANLLEAQGKTRSAAQAYGVALTQKPADSALDDATSRAVDHALLLLRDHRRDLESFLSSAAPPETASGASAVKRRMSGFYEHMLGKRRPYLQQPTNLYYPGLPSIEIHDREDFSFLAELEAATPQIRAELESVLGDDPEVSELEPYMQRPPDEPVQQWGELNNSLRWSAYHFSIYGRHYPAHRTRCPRTTAMLDKVGQPVIRDRSPSAMFSILQPRAHIPAHNGAGNIRLLCHLPLIVPDGCRFRVGNTIREWREGEAFVFDDTIEHEAWNDSDHTRAVLIFDVWNPAITPEERDYIARILGAVDSFVEAE